MTDRPFLSLSRRLRGLMSVLVGGALVLSGGALVTVAGPAPIAAAAAPAVSVTRVVGGLAIPWDVTWVGGLMLFDQRAGGVSSKRGNAAVRPVEMVGMPRIWANGEGGMLGMVADPRAASNKRFYTCMVVAASPGRRADVQVWSWRLTSDTRAVKVTTLVRGLPVTTGRHSGCRLLFRSAASLYVGTGDAVQGTNPQNLMSLGGKILRVRSDGYAYRSNPFYRRGGNARYVWSYGHRNVQGLAKRPGRNEVWSVEQGTDRDDEVNLVKKGGNYGYSPTPGYNERRSMTDKRRYPRAVTAKWRSGSSTIATCGATFLSGSRWGSWNGKLAVAVLKGHGIQLFSVSSNRRLSGAGRILTGYGRIRSVIQGPDGNLYFTTSNGSDDGIYRITPR